MEIIPDLVTFAMLCHDTNKW